MLKQIGLSRNLAVISVTIFLNLFVQYMWYPLLPLYLRSLGANDWQIGVSFTLIGLAHTLFAVLGGALADRYGRKLITAAPTFAMVPLYLIAGITSNWVVVVAMFVGTNILGAIQWPAMSALIIESSSEDRVARSFSFSETAVLIGLILGPLAGAALLSSFSISNLIVWYGIMLIGTSSLRAWGLRESARRTVGSAQLKVHAAIDANILWFIAAGTFITTAFAICYGPYFAILARDAWHNREAEINLLWSAGSFASLVGILLGRQSDHWGARRVLVLAALAFGGSTIAWGIAPTWQWGIVPLLISFLFSEAMFIAQQTIQAEITTPETRSSVIGVVMTTTGFVGGLGPTLGAWLITLGGNALPFVAAGMLGLGAVLAVLPIRTRTSRAAQAAGSIPAE